MVPHYHLIIKWQVGFYLIISSNVGKKRKSRMFSQTQDKPKLRRIKFRIRAGNSEDESW